MMLQKLALPSKNRITDLHKPVPLRDVFISERDLDFDLDPVETGEIDANPVIGYTDPPEADPFDDLPDPGIVDEHRLRAIESLLKRRSSLKYRSYLKRNSRGKKYQLGRRRTKLDHARMRAAS
jgi:hypothetical protein